MKQGIFNSFKNFFNVFFGTLGFLFAFLVLGLLFGLAKSTDSSEIEQKFTPEIVANANGVRKAKSASAPVILEIDIDGIIGTRELNGSTVRRQLLESREDTLEGDRVKAILLYINTPGGTVTDANDIYRALMQYKAKYNVPIYAYVDGMSASGGMYVACAADKIFASDASIIGSIGVISPSIFNVSSLLDKLGVQSLTLYSGKGKDALNPTRPWKPGEEDNYKDLITYFYSQFVDLVVKSRPEINKKALVEEYGANIYPASTAQKIGFIDDADSSREKTLRALLEKLSIEDDYYQVIKLKDENWFSKLFEARTSALMTPETLHKIVIPEALPEELNGKFLYLWHAK
ncbi:S49 family peptidase [Criblamydia sequanensis]|uniref:Signal peptide peptidase SppA n=1 Tax=Candidatus Criblamydia sequanensis CRIB-18 TaxID=1437425 RepID=A0A090D2P0_9BACT|nr:S49 family peptidase [Criblamydia sequanensis]CDR34785.1 Putative signal peptide peptidase SppA [Criblamydia sequanensis CRIB-18]